MSHEIERKFLVRSTGFLRSRRGQRMVQGYIANTRSATVRVRIAGAKAWLTLKGRSKGITRRELEYPIPVSDAKTCLAELSQGPSISKTRYRVKHGRHTWEVDVFDGANAGLVLAEVELGSEDEKFARPAWLGEEVSTDKRYFNSYLTRHPFSKW